MLYDQDIRRMKTPDKYAYKIADNGPCPGLIVRITPAGHKSFVLRLRINGKRKERHVGNYGEIGLSEARKKGLKLRGKVELGENIWNTKPEPEQPKVATLEELCEGYAGALKARGARRHKEVKRTLDNDCTSLYKKSANKITPQEIADVIRKVVKRGSVGQANKVRTALHAAYNWGMAADLDTRRDSNGSHFQIVMNPVTPIPKPRKGTNALERFLTEKELKLIWHEMPNHMNFNSYTAIRLLLCTGQRVEEILNTRWDQIEDDVLYLPTTKNGKPHEIALNETALILIDEIRIINGHCEVLFPQRDAKHTPMKSTSLSHALKKLCRRTGLPSFTPRDSRRTVKTLAVKHGIDKDIMDKIQNHAQHDVSTIHYLRYYYLPQKREAMAEWNEILMDILS